jgi:GT2 family glycosyltransferase
MKRNPEVSIVVLNWNGYSDTHKCIESISNINYNNYHIILVDNDSKEDELAELKADFGNEIIGIQNSSNLGFGAGNNKGIEWAIENRDPDYVLTLNNDTTVEQDFLISLIEGIRAQDQDEKIAAAGPIVLDQNDPSTVWSAGVKKENFLNSTKVLHRQKPVSSLPTRPFYSDGIVGCAVLYNVNCLREIGLIDEDYFLGYEEHDWCHRAYAEGYEFLIVPDSIVYHEISSSRGRDNPLYEYYAKRNRLLFYQKNLNGVLLLVALLLFSARFILDCAHLLTNDKQRSIAGMKGIIDGVTKSPPRKIP